MPDAHTAPAETATLAPLLALRDRVLLPGMTARQAMAAFEAAEAEALAVVDALPSGRVLGLLMGAMFDTAFRKFAEAFERRADEVYGRGGAVAT